MDQTKISRSLYSDWSNEQLVATLTRHRGEYLPDALASVEAELVGRGVRLDDLTRLQEATESREAHDEQQELSRIRGWLLFAIVVVLFSTLKGASAVPYLMQSARSLHGSVPRFAFTSIALGTGVQAAYGAFLFILLVRRKPMAPVHAARWAVLIVFTELVPMVLIAAIGTRVLPIGTLLVLAVTEIALVCLWVAYFRKSRRVAAVYGFRGMPPQLQLR